MGGRDGDILRTRNKSADEQPVRCGGGGGGGGDCVVNSDDCDDDVFELLTLDAAVWPTARAPRS